MRIVSALRSGPKSVSELAESLAVEVVTVSHHLGILRNAHLVETERKGRFISTSAESIPVTFRVTTVEVLPLEFLRVALDTQDDHTAFTAAGGQGGKGDHLPPLRLIDADRE